MSLSIFVLPSLPAWRRVAFQACCASCFCFFFLFFFSFFFFFPRPVLYAFLGSFYSRDPAYSCFPSFLRGLGIGTPTVGATSRVGCAAAKANCSDLDQLNLIAGAVERWINILHESRPGQCEDVSRVFPVEDASSNL